MTSGKEPRAGTTLPLQAELQAVVDRALAEDLALGDVTTEALVPSDAPGKGTVFSKAAGVLCGVPVATLVFQRVDPLLEVEQVRRDGDRLEPGSTILHLSGPAASMLRAERVALNFLQHLSSVATETARYVERVRGLSARIADTRKTLPGLRSLQKYAVVVGGGVNHRRSLGDGILIKDNHLAVLRAQGLTLKDVVRRALRNAPHTVTVEVEVTTLDEVTEALAAGAHVLLLDNMPLDEMRRAMELARGRAVVEASGGITLETVRAVAETGVDLISVGALSHSVHALDLSMDVELAQAR
ncbi:MAG: carboxylating nicotinate-nucleotide diphosphorylase [Dehalococcoidia bacterium]|nr:carboxylating nicotinate-nucleotide diphosphorylase [Dehalococcoidia bacterium]